MRLPPSLSRRVWLLAPALALAFFVWANAVRIQRIAHLTALPQWSVDPAKIDRASPTGYADGRRELIIPEHNNDSYQWIAQTQQMFATHTWRLRHVDYDNAPLGREVALPSLYRWWLGFVAWCDHTLSGRSLALAVEHGAFWADPVLQLLLLVSATAFAFRQAGGRAAALVAAACVTLFPFASSFLAGAPDRQALALLCAVGSVLPLFAGIKAAADDSLDASLRQRRARRWFAVAAVAGGIGLWVNLDTQWLLLLGLAAGAVTAAWITRKNTLPLPALPWRWWGLCGCAASLLTYLAEYFPDHLTWRLDVNHPLFALSWWGLGELVARSTAWLQHRPSDSKRADLAGWLLGLVLFAATPLAAFWSGSRGWLADDAVATRLTTLKGGIVAPNFGAWLVHDGLSAAVWATVLPLALVGLAFGRLARRSETPAARAALLVALGALVFVLPAAFVQLRTWATVDALLLPLLVILAARPAAPVASTRSPDTWLWLAGAGGVAALGLTQLWPATATAGQITLTEVEVQGVVERDLAQWLARRIDTADAVVLAPPDLTTSLYFHGGIRGLGTLHPENREGVGAAVRIVSATSRDEALALCRGRNITHLLVPSWDNFLDDYAAMGTSMPEKSFLAALHRWVQPNWIRPVPYTIPAIPGIDPQTVAVFQLVEEQEQPLAASRLAEYFLETNQIETATAMTAALRRYPGDIGALVALAEIAAARADSAAFASALETLLPYVKAGAARTQAWDRRVSLAIVLAQARRVDLATEEAKRCLAQLDEARVRSLTTGALFRFQVLCKVTGLEIRDARLRDLARSLLPPDLRKRV